MIVKLYVVYMSISLLGIIATMTINSVGSLGTQHWTFAWNGYMLAAFSIGGIIGLIIFVISFVQYT